MNCTALKYVDGERSRPVTLHQAVQVTLHIGHTGAGGGDEEGVCGGGASIKLFQWELVP